MNKKYRQKLFAHLQGIVLVPILNAFFESTILKKHILKNSICLNDLKNENVNMGYINVALRILKSSNYLDFVSKGNEYEHNYIFNDNFKHAYKNKEIFKKFSRLLDYNSQFGSNENTEKFILLINECLDTLNNLKIDKEDVLFIQRIEGILIGPILNNLGFLNYLDNFNSENFVLKNLNENLRSTIDTVLIESNIITLKNENYIVTEEGQYFLSRVSSYGVTCSYIPTLSKMNQLLFDDCTFIWKKNDLNNEIHVNRSMNVWGSGGSHKVYFKKIDTIIKKIFNSPLNNQPKAIIDVGCGDGTFLKHAYKIVKEETLRGKNLKEMPLNIIGVDINKAARIASRKKLNNAKIDNIIINGSINDPHEINNNLKEQFNIELSDCLNMRTFLDHNRIFKKPKKMIHKNIKSDGSFCYKGKLITNDEIINNLIEHFSNWAPYIHNYGLILLELHTIPSKNIKENLLDTPAIAYDATHGFSDQYLVEHKVFEECLIKSGLKLSLEYQTLFPDKKNPTISINFIK